MDTAEPTKKDGMISAAQAARVLYDNWEGLNDLPSPAREFADQGHFFSALRLIFEPDADLRRPPAVAAHPTTKPARDGYQDRVSAAHHELFHDDPTDITERLARFMEEANETCQAFGMSREDAHRLVDYTYGRPEGEPAKEIGAAMLTLTSLCVVAGYDLMSCAEAELQKLQQPKTIARIRAKRSTRHGRGPLPGFDPRWHGKDGGQEDETVAWLHPTANWSHVDYDRVRMHCGSDGPLPIHLYAAPPQSTVDADTVIERLEEIALAQKAYHDRKQQELPSLDDFLDEDGVLHLPDDIGPLLSHSSYNGRYSEADWWVSTIRKMRAESKSPPSDRALQAAASDVETTASSHPVPKQGLPLLEKKGRAETVAGTDHPSFHESAEISKSCHENTPAVDADAVITELFRKNDVRPGSTFTHGACRALLAEAIRIAALKGKPNRDLANLEAALAKRAETIGFLAVEDIRELFATGRQEARDANS